MSVLAWGATFLGAYFALTVYFGLVGMRRTRSSDDFATARGSYSGLLLGFSYVAMAASGSTFLGIPGIAYEEGFKGGYYPMLYVSIYLGSMLGARHLKRLGDRLGSQTVPDFLGDIYRSPALRVMAALISFFLIYYVMGQFAASGQIFETIFGIPYQVGVWVAIGIVMIYMTIGGTHSDIITDAIQGLLMLAVAVFIIGAFVVGAGVNGWGPVAVNSALPEQMQWTTHTDPASPNFSSWWVLALLFVAHLGFITLPHLGNKFFAMRGIGQVRRFVVMSSITGITVGFMFLGGVLGRAMGIEDIHPDTVIPNVFMQLLPAWTAALLSIAVLSAIISTTDGLLMSISQLVANDLYRKTWVPWRGKDPESPQVDRRALAIGRIGILVAGVIAGIAVYSPPKLLTLLMWVGIGGIIVTLGGPMLLAIFWRRRANAFGAITGGLLAFALYFWLHLGPGLGLYEGFYPWNQNPFASTAVAGLAGVVLCTGFSLAGRPLPAEHRAKLDAAETGDEYDGARPPREVETD